MLGVSLLYVGAVLTINGIGRLTEIDGKSLAVMNFFTGGLSVIANVILLVCGEYYAAATGLLFGFTYLFIGLNAVFNLDGRVLGWFSLFVAINTVPAALLSLEGCLASLSIEEKKELIMDLFDQILWDGQCLQLFPSLFPQREDSK